MNPVQLMREVGDWWQDGNTMFEVAHADEVGEIVLCTSVDRNREPAVRCWYAVTRAADKKSIKADDYGDAIVFLHGGREQLRAKLNALMDVAFADKS